MTTMKRPKRISTPIMELLSIVALDTKISKKKMLSNLPDESVADARHRAMALAAQAGHGLDAIASVFGFDPAAVKDAIDGIEHQRRADSRLDDWFCGYSLVLTVPVDG